MPGTVLVETLLECNELNQLYDATPSWQDRSDLRDKIAAAEEILDYLRSRFIDANRSFSDCVQDRLFSSPQKLPDETGIELSSMDHLSLLRYGTVLKYVCTAEAETLEMPLDASKAQLQQARAEWQRRFGNTAISQSF